MFLDLSRVNGGVRFLAILSLAWLSFIPASLFGQSVKLPDGWESFSVRDFAGMIRPIQEQKTFDFLSGNDQQAIKTRAKTLFDQIDLTNTSLSYETVEMVHWPIRHELLPEEMANIRSALIARQDDWTGIPYEEARAKVRMMMRLKFDEATIIGEARRWVQAGGTIDQVPAEDLSFDIVRQIFTDIQLIEGSFTVTWEGLLIPPQSGAFQFQASPINLGAAYNPKAFRLSMTASVANNPILETIPTGDTPLPAMGEPTAWVSQSKAVTLTAGQAVPIQVKVTVDALDALPGGLLHALLYWKVPGGLTEIIPAESFKLPDGSARGLRTTYTWGPADQQQSLTRTEPNIDVAWTNSRILLAKDTSVASRSAETLWQSLSAAKFISSLVGPPAKQHRFLGFANDSSAALTSARRAKFLDLLVQNPALLDPVDAKFIVRFFEAFRIGAPDKALDAFGIWAARHPDVVCDLSNDRVYNGDQRYAYARMAVLTTQQLSYQSSDLQSKYLQLPDGRCSLPVAYTLACSYLSQKRYDDWLAFLDAKLADSSLAGDVRVNWLIARAYSQELQPGSIKHYPLHYGVPLQEPGEGRTYLDEALKVAQSSSVKLRVAQEIIGRLAFKQRYQDAKKVLDTVTASLSADQKIVAAGLQQRLDEFSSNLEQQKANQAAQAKQAHLTELKRRRDQAAQRGDDKAVSRYDALIGAASGQ